MEKDIEILVSINPALNSLTDKYFNKLQSINILSMEGEDEYKSLMINYLQEYIQLIINKDSIKYKKINAIKNKHKHYKVKRTESDSD
jgi:hypothetical protein